MKAETPANSSADPEHWDGAYALGDSTRGWYQPEAITSLSLIRDTGIPSESAIVDVGAGASVLVDDLLAAGYRDITLVDHSVVGLQIARRRLGDRAQIVNWVVEDLRTWRPHRRFRVWHDRAVAHFLLDDADRDRYRQTLLAATGPGSHVVIGVFGPEGPDMCAGLPVRRHSVDDVRELLGPSFAIVTKRTVDHIRPDGATQQFLWVLAERR